MKILSFTGLSLFLLIIAGCNALLGHKSGSDQSTQVSIVQNGEETVIKKQEKTVKLDKAPFSIRYFNKKYDPESKKFYSARITAFENKTKFKSLKAGVKRSSTPCFKPGTGMAASKSGKYSGLFFTSHAHHYLFYENEADKRVDSIGKKGDKLKFEFPVKKVYINDNQKKMSEIGLSEFHLAIYIDRDLDDTVDKNELRKITIKLN